MRQILLATALFSVVAASAGADPLGVGSAVAPPADPVLDEDVGFRGCGSHAAVVRWLAGTFSEKPMARGVQGDGQILEIYMAKEGATWTVVVTDPSGESCIVSEGTSMELLPAEPSGPMA